MAKKNCLLRRNKNQNREFADTVNLLHNKYYNLYRANFKWRGVPYRAEDYIMRNFYKRGTVSAFVITDAQMLGYTGYTVQSWDMYDCPETILFTNERGVPFIPSTVQTVDVNCVIGFLQFNKKPLYKTVDYYVQRIAQVEMVININLNLQKMPFIIPVDGDDAKINDIVDRILAGELVIFAPDVDPMTFKSVSTGAPYVIDKLVQYKTSLENELKTILGVDNTGTVQKLEQIQMDEINAGNDEINDFGYQFVKNLQSFCKRVRNVLGYDIWVESTSAPVDSIGQVHVGAKPGPKGGENDDFDR